MIPVASVVMTASPIDSRWRGVFVVPGERLAGEAPGVSRRALPESGPRRALGLPIDRRAPVPIQHDHGIGRGIKQLMKSAGS
jgi:hypothetical protein